MDDNKQLMVVLLFARILSHYQCALVLAERGAAVSTKALIRVLLEAVFTLGACVKDSTFLDIYAKDDRRRQAELIEALLNFRNEEIGVTSKELERLRQQAASLRAEIREDKSPKIGAFDAARRAGLLSFYHLFYVPYCNAVHTSARDLVSHVQENSQGGIKLLQCGPESAEVEDIVDATIQIFFSAIPFVFQIFPQPDQENEFERLWTAQNDRLTRKAERRRNLLCSSNTI